MKTDSSLKKNELVAAVFDAIDYWKDQCGYRGKEFFDNWKVTNKEKVNIWFYFVDGVVFKQPAAFACGKPRYYLCCFYLQMR